MPCILDSGAYMTTIPAPDLQIQGTTAIFQLAGKTIVEPILRYQMLQGFTAQPSSHPVIKLTMTVDKHTAEEEIALNLPNTAFLVGRTFLAGRVLVESTDPAKPSTQKW